METYTIRRTIILILLILLIIPFSACSQPAAAPSPTLPPPAATTQPTIVPTFTATVIPTATNTSTPRATRTLLPTWTETPIPTDIPEPECKLSDPEDATVLDPKPSGEPDWCMIEYSDFTIPFPSQWSIEAGGAWNQTRRFYVPLDSGNRVAIFALAHITDQPVEEADKTVMVDGEGGQSFQTPVIDPDETDLVKSVQTFGDEPVLVVTTKKREETIQRYFWLSPQLLGESKRTFVYFKVEGPTVDFGNSEYTEILEQLEAVVSRVHLTPTCADGFTRLHRGIHAQLTPGKLPNRVRSGPSKQDEVIAQLYAGTIVAVGDGPVCADGLVFWRVYSEALEHGSGWTAEGDFNEHWLEPYEP